jgi:hypothetical protein
MAYIDPQTVVTPRNRIRSVDVLYNSGPGPGSWSAALLEFDGEQRVALRWNGGEGTGMGNPQSRGKPTWFVVPPELGEVVRDEAERLANTQEGGLLGGYREMANDREREAEAQEWAEGLIADAARQEG